MPSKHFRKAFDRAVLQTNRTKISGRADSILFREQHNIGSVDSLKLKGVVIERLKDIGDRRGGGTPGRFIERRPKAIRPGTGRCMHRKESSLDFVLSERPIKSGEAWDGARIQRI